MIVAATKAGCCPNIGPDRITGLPQDRASFFLQLAVTFAQFVDQNLAGGLFGRRRGFVECLEFMHGDGPFDQKFVTSLELTRGER